MLAYIGVSLPLLVLLAAGGQDVLAISSTEAVAVEVVRALVGSLGIVAAVPLTTAIVVVLVRRGGRRVAAPSEDDAASPTPIGGAV